MGAGGGRGGTDGCLEFLRKLILWFNVVFIVMGAGMVALGIWITQDADFKQWVVELGMGHYWAGVYILMAAGAMVMLQSFFGICGAHQQSPRMLSIFQGCLLVCLVLEITGAAYMLANGIRYSSIERWLERRFYQLIAEYNHHPASARVINIIQDWVHCCGATSSRDYVRWNKVIPSTCYNPVTGNAWYVEGLGYVGCVQAFTMMLEHKTAWIAGLALVLAFFQMFCVGFTCYMIQYRKAYVEYRRSQADNLDWK